MANREREASSDCLFCRIVAGEIPAEKVFETDTVLAFRDINPIAPSHVLLIPKRHIPTVDDLTAAHDAEIGELMRAASEVARLEGLKNGYRLVINCGKGAGQVVMHVHVHLVGGRRLGWPPG